MPQIPPNTAGRWLPAVRQCTLRAGAFAIGAAVLSLMQYAAPQRRLFLCPLRAVTGVPCPMCGGSTAAISLARLDIPGALVANPFAVAGAIALVVLPLLIASPRSQLRWPARRTQVLVLLGILGLAEAWQLVRLAGSS